MDKKTQKEFNKLDKEIKDLHKTTIMVNNQMQKIMGIKSEEEEEESDEENGEFNYLNNANEEEVSAILQKAEQEMKEEEEEKKRQKKETEEEVNKMEKMLKEELENVSDEEKKKKKKKKKEKKKNKEKNNNNENSENKNQEDDESYKEFIEFQKWKKMKELQKEKEKQKVEENNNNKSINEKKEEENNNVNINKKEIIDINKVENPKDENNKKQAVKNENKTENENNNENKEKDFELDFNINNINNNQNNIDNNDNININNQFNDNNNNNNDNFENNNNNAQKNNKSEHIIPKNVYDKISSNDKKFVTDLLKACNAKFQEGEVFTSMGKYSEALKCYSISKNLFMKSSKVIQSKKNVYPKEFMMKITSIISDKLKLVHQAAKNCSNAMKEKIINKVGLKNNNTINNNFDNINNVDNYNNNNNDMNNNGNNNIDNNKNNDNETNNNTKVNNNKANLDKNDDKNKNNYNYDFNELNNNNKNNNNNKFRNQNSFNNNNNNPDNKPKSLHDKEADAMDEKILSEIMTKNPGVKFSDIIGMNDMKQTLYEIIVVPTIRPDLFTGIRTPQRGILLFGPPGTGKTMIAKAIASECGSTFFNISASSLTSKWVGESEKTVKSLFKIAYQKVPSIIFIDEIDSILSKRSESENEATKRLKTEFLIQFDGLGSNTSARLLVIAATNRPMDLDEALLRRLPKRVYCGPLDENGRFEFIKKVINRVETDLSDDDIREIAKMTNDYSNSDLMELCREAAYRPVRELTNDEIMKLDKFRAINKKDLLDAVHKIRGTLSKKVKEDLRKWNEQFGGV